MNQKLLLGVVIHSPKESFKLPDDLKDYIDVCLVKNRDTEYMVKSEGDIELFCHSSESIGNKRNLVLDEAKSRGYKKLTFVDPDDQVLDWSYLVKGKDLYSDLVCCDKLRGDIVTDIDNRLVDFKKVNQLPLKVNHGPMNIVDVDLCKEHDIQYDDSWLDDVDFFLRYTNYIDMDKIYFCDKPCYNHVKNSGSLSDLSSRFLKSAREVRMGKPDYRKETFELFCRWYDAKFGN